MESEDITFRLRVIQNTKTFHHGNGTSDDFRAAPATYETYMDPSHRVEIQSHRPTWGGYQPDVQSQPAHDTYQCNVAYNIPIILFDKIPRELQLDLHSIGFIPAPTNDFLAYILGRIEAPKKTDGALLHTMRHPAKKADEQGCTINDVLTAEDS